MNPLLLSWKIRLYDAVVLLVLLGISAPCTAQSTQDPTDSLRRKLNEARSAEEKIEVLHSLSEISIADSSINYSKYALTLAQNLQSVDLIGEGLLHLGSIYVRTSHYDDALQTLKRAVGLGMTGNNNVLLADAYLEIGIVYVRQQHLDSARAVLNKSLSLELGKDKDEKNALVFNMLGNVAKEENKFEEALAQYIRATGIFEKINNLEGFTQSLSNIGNIQYLLGDYDKALKYGHQCLDIAIRLKKQSSIAYANRLLGRIYRRQKKFSEALSNYKRALAIYELRGERRDAAETLSNIGNIFFELEEYSNANKHYSESIRLQRIIRDSVGMAYSFNAKAITYEAINDLEKSIAYFDSAMLFARKKKLHPLVMDGYYNKSSLYSARKKYQLAYENYLLYSKMKDSLEQLRNKGATEELEVKYQNEKKENEIKALHAENQIKTLQLEKERTQQLYLAAFAVLSLLLIAVLYNRYRIKQRTAAKLGQLDAAKSRFFTNITHEFRTPLTLILGPLQRALSLSAGISEQEVPMMHRNASRLNLLINQILELSKIEAGKMKLQVHDVDLRRMIATACSAFQSQADQRNINYTIEIQHNVGNGLIDQEKIETILFNLVSNAFKFTQEGGTISIQVSRDSRLIIRVRDSGIGIAARHLDSVFDRFYQADDSSTRATEGTGIGLALAKELADFHYGELSVSSEEGKGSEFVLSVPVDRKYYRPDDILQQRESGDRNASIYDFVDGAASGGSVIDNTDESFPLILVAEDNMDMRGFIRDILKSNYRIEEAVDGVEAWKKAVASVPDLVITDVMMPHMDGTTLCDKLKDNLATNHIPVVMLTARAGQVSKLDGLKHGADDYLIKPFDTNELQIRVKNLLDQRRKLRDRYRQEIILQPSNIEVTAIELTFLQQLHIILDKKYSDPNFGVEALNTEIGLSRMQLHRKLKALTDQSTGEFIRNFRLDKAKQYLRLKDAQVSQVAYDCGFNNVSHFGKTFREHTGMTPSEYIASNQVVKSE